MNNNNGNNYNNGYDGNYNGGYNNGYNNGYNDGSFNNNYGNAGNGGFNNGFGNSGNGGFNNSYGNSGNGGFNNGYGNSGNGGFNNSYGNSGNGGFNNGYGNSGNGGFNNGYGNSGNGGFNNSYGNSGNGGFNNSYGNSGNGGFNNGYGNSGNGGFNNGYGNSGNGGFNNGYGNSGNGGFNNSYGNSGNGGFNDGYNNGYNNGYNSFGIDKDPRIPDEIFREHPDAKIATKSDGIKPLIASTILFIILSFISGMLFVFIENARMETDRIIDEGVAVEGVITDLWTKRRSSYKSSRTVHYAEYCYTYDNETYTAQTEYDYENYSIGQTVTVYVDPENPYQSRLHRESAFLSYTMLLIDIPFAVYWITTIRQYVLCTKGRMVIYKIPSRKNRRTLTTIWKKIN